MVDAVAPPGPPQDVTVNQGIARFTYQDYYPGSDYELEQGEGLEALPEDIVALMRAPLMPRNDKFSDIINTNDASYFPLVVGTTQAIQALIANNRRTYLALQNQGPGNIWFNFTNVAVVGQCLQIIPGAFYEPQATGSFRTGALVPPRSAVYLIADVANTVCVVCEGSAMAY